MRVRFRHAILGISIVGFAACSDPTAPPRPEPTNDDDDEKTGVIVVAVTAPVQLAGIGTARTADM